MVYAAETGLATSVGSVLVIVTLLVLPTVNYACML
jgi:hypothetical protein